MCEGLRIGIKDIDMEAFRSALRIPCRHEELSASGAEASGSEEYITQEDLARSRAGKSERGSGSQNRCSRDTRIAALQCELNLIQNMVCYIIYYETVVVRITALQCMFFEY